MTGYRWVILAAGSFASVTYTAIQWGLPALAPALRERYDLSLPDVGLVFTAVTAGSILTILPWGLAIDRFDERTVMTIGLLGAGSSLVLAGLTSSLSGLVAALMLASMLGAGTLNAGGRAVMGWFVATERAFAIGVRQMSMPLGGAIMAFALPAIYAAAGLHACFFVMGGLAFVGAACASTLLRSPPMVEDARAAGQPVAEDLGDASSRIGRLSLGCAAIIVAQGGLLSFLVLFLHDQRNLSMGAAAATLAGVQIGAGFLRLGFGRLSDRLGSRIQLIRSIAAVSAVLLAAAALLDSSAGFLLYPVLMTAGALSMAWNGLALTASAEFAGYERAGRGMGQFTTTVQLAFMAASVSFGSLVAATSWSIGFVTLACTSLVGIAILSPLVAPERRALAA